MLPPRTVMQIVGRTALLASGGKTLVRSALLCCDIRGAAHAVTSTGEGDHAHESSPRFRRVLRRYIAGCPTFGSSKHPTVTAK
jgi:hypothetical protein